MKEVLYRQLAATIHECRTWVDVLDTDRTGNFMLHSGGGLHPIRCRVLSLVARTAHGAYSKGHVWDRRGGHHPPRLAQTHQLGT